MNTIEEKLSILSEMIVFAKVNGPVTELEYHFLLSVAERLSVDRKKFDALFENQTDHIILKTEGDRILQFHRLMLLMNIDQVQDETEVGRLHTIGLGMGLPPSAIDQVLSVMHQYPNKVVPPKVLIAIFKTHYN